jgi:predicted Zn-dependent protease
MRLRSSRHRDRSVVPICVHLRKSAVHPRIAHRHVRNVVAPGGCLRFLPGTSVKSRILVRVIPIFIALLVVFFQRCSATKIVNEAGRTARLGMSPQQELSLGAQAYRQVLSESRTITSGESYEMVKRCAARLTAVTGDAGKDFQWAVSVVQSDQVNAFCLPGGKIVVYTGILPVAQNETGLAVVMGHELSHATLHHGAERVLQQQTKNTLLTGVNYSLGDMSYQQRRQLMGLIGAGTDIAFVLPFSRDHESEADSVGLRTMARAGYDPREAVRFWQRMTAQAGKGAPPQFLSTHPAHETRIERLKKDLPKAIEIYQSAGGR